MASTPVRFAKAVAIYSLLVVPPVAGLLVILHCGEDLRPPRSIGGDWLLTTSAQACAHFDANKPVPLAISQSGLRALGQLAGTSLSLRIEGTAVTGDGDTSGCHLVLTAQLGATGLDGVLHWPGCTGCSDQRFHASRAPRTEGAK